MITVADSGFPRGGGANSPGGGRQHMILPYFPEKCMKLKEFGPRGGGHASLAFPLDPPLDKGCMVGLICGIMFIELKLNLQFESTWQHHAHVQIKSFNLFSCIRKIIILGYSYYLYYSYTTGKNNQHISYIPVYATSLLWRLFLFGLKYLKGSLTSCSVTLTIFYFCVR